MKILAKVSLFALAAIALASCAPPTTSNVNGNANANANMAAKPAAPSADTLMALENKAWEAYKNRDGKFFEGFLGDSMISGDGSGIMSRADVVKVISEHKDDVKSYSLSDAHVTPVNADTAVLTYKGTVEGTMDGKPMPSPVTVATVFVRSGSDWKAVYHNEIPFVQPPATGGNTNTNSAAAPAPAADADKKEMPAPPPASNSNAASNSNSAPSADPLLDALMAQEKKGWEGWKAKDAAALDAVTAKDFTFVDLTGKVTKTKADAIKSWTTDNPCNVSSVSLSDGKALSIGTDAAILVVKGTAVGTCGDQKLEPLWNTTVFVKEGGTWKAAYIFESPVKK